MRRPYSAHMDYSHRNSPLRESVAGDKLRWKDMHGGGLTDGGRTCRSIPHARAYIMPGEGIMRSMLHHLVTGEVTQMGLEGTLRYHAQRPRI